MHDPHGCRRRPGWMHYHAAGVVDVKGDDENEAYMCEARVVVNDIDFIGFQEKIEVENTLAKLKDEIDIATSPVESITVRKACVLWNVREDTIAMKELKELVPRDGDDQDNSVRNHGW